MPILPAQQDSLLSPVVWRCECLMRLVVREDALLPAQGCPSVEERLLPCHILTDRWAGQGNHLNRVLGLTEASDLPDHYPLVTLGHSLVCVCTVRHSGSELKAKQMQENSVTHVAVLFEWKDCAVFARTHVSSVLEVKEK